MSKLIAGAMTLILAAPAFAQMPPTSPQTPPQFLAAQNTQFDTTDANHDGVVTKAELSAAMAQMMGSEPPAAMLDAIYRMMDTNGDGKATAAEGAAAAQARFARWDTNHDGTLSVEEQQAGMMAMMQELPAQ